MKNWIDVYIVYLLFPNQLPMMAMTEGHPDDWIKPESGQRTIADDLHDYQSAQTNCHTPIVVFCC